LSVFSLQRPQIFAKISMPYIWLFKALRLFFLPNFPSPMFISCLTSIPESRVNIWICFNFQIFFGSTEDQNRCKQFPPFILDCIKWHVLTCNSYSQVRNSYVLITRQGHFSLLMNSYLGYWIPHKEEVVDPNRIIGPSNSLTLFKILRLNFVENTL
jgi:hypothetical protein